LYPTLALKSEVFEQLNEETKVFGLKVHYFNSSSTFSYFFFYFFKSLAILCKTNSSVCEITPSSGILN
jgi:hypothetical protein